jgi:glycine cleavage system aminomethyltransferase T
VQPLTGQDLSSQGLPYFRMAAATVAGLETRMARVSYVGELGWEISADVRDGLALWDALWEAGRDVGAVAAGRAAFNSLRLEKGYRAWGADLDTGRDPFQSGLGFTVHRGKVGYVGRDAVERLRDEDPRGRDRLRCLTVDDAAAVVMGSEPVFAAGRRVGHTTSAAYGYTVHRPIAYAWLSGDVAVGDTVAVRSFDRMVPATVTATPLVDPDGTALRG